mgnify:CR=1 FL=1
MHVGQLRYDHDGARLHELHLRELRLHELRLHELHTVMRTSDRVICLNHSICCEGAPDVVSVAPEYRLLFGLDDDQMFANYRHHEPETPLQESFI